MTWWFKSQRASGEVNAKTISNQDKANMNFMIFELYIHMYIYMSACKLVVVLAAFVSLYGCSDG